MAKAGASSNPASHHSAGPPWTVGSATRSNSTSLFLSNISDFVTTSPAQPSPAQSIDCHLELTRFIPWLHTAPSIVGCPTPWPAVAPSRLTSHHVESCRQPALDTSSDAARIGSRARLVHRHTRYHLSGVWRVVVSELWVGDCAHSPAHPSSCRLTTQPQSRRPV